MLCLCWSHDQQGTNCSDGDGLVHYTGLANDTPGELHSYIELYTINQVEIQVTLSSKRAISSDQTL